MNAVVEYKGNAEKTFKIDVEPEIADAAIAIFERQGMTNKEGGARLLRWFSQQEEGLQAVILGQVRGNAAQLIARAILGDDQQEQRMKAAAKPKGPQMPGR